jgi:predicted dehydrogenase
MPQKVKQIIESGKIGRVLSTSITCNSYNFGQSDMESIAYLSDIATGGNMATIHFSHQFDCITQALGPLSTFTSTAAITRPVTQLRTTPLTLGPDSTATFVGSVPRTTPDLIMLQGKLASGAFISYYLRGGAPVPDTPGLVWSVYGEKGEIRLTTNGSNLHIGAPSDAIVVHDQHTNTVESVPLDTDKWDELPFPARNVARVYEAFAEDKGGYGTWDDSIERHKFVEEVMSRGA